MNMEKNLVIWWFENKKVIVNQILIEFIQRRKQREITALFGNFPQDADYDYKKGRE